MPRMCPLMTNPTTAKVACPWTMCSGVITITLTITMWASAIIPMPCAAT